MGRPERNISQDAWAPFKPNRDYLRPWEGRPVDPDNDGTSQAGLVKHGSCPAPITPVNNTTALYSSIAVLDPPSSVRYWIWLCQLLGLGQFHGHWGNCQLQSVMIMFHAQFNLQLYLLHAGFCYFIASRFNSLPLHVFNDFSWEVFNCRRQAFHYSTREIGCKLFFLFVVETPLTIFNRNDSSFLHVQFSPRPLISRRPHALVFLLFCAWLKTLVV